ncbi:MAG TPA: hypothetical protein VD927_08205, partial [Chryseosolibacter sp.]|nr:hypothetical protein [Chryseosolibacter sp.]
SYISICFGHKAQNTKRFLRRAAFRSVRILSPACANASSARTIFSTGHHSDTFGKPHPQSSTPDAFTSKIKNR